MPDTARLTTALADRYIIERELGQGGMATVYLARDLKHDREVALKVLRPELAAVLGAERFLNEIKITARLDHPHILTLIDSGTADGFLYYVLPYVRGESLRDRLNRDRRLGVEEALAIVRQVAGALDYAHRQGVVHRDIKPENILIQEGEAMLADFGIALAVKEAGGNRLTGTGLSLGTPQYMSPEQATGETALDGRTDIYSLGVMLYEMLAGQPPFTGTSVQALIASVLTQEPPPLPAAPGVSGELRRAVTRALARASAGRFATAAEFSEALRRAQAERAPAPRRGVLVPAAAALAGLALVAALIWWRMRPEGGPLAPLATKLAQQTFDEAVEEWPAWSPDGQQFVFSRNVAGYRNLFLRRLDTGEERPLTHGARDDIQAAWAPDGRHIAFVRSNLPSGKLEPGDVLGWYVDGDVWTVDVQSGQEAQLLAGAFDPSYSPDGSQLAVDASWGGPRRLWLTDPIGHNPRQVTTDSSEGVVHMSPRWSPDGRRLVFRRVQQSKSDIAVLELASGTIGWVTHDDVPDANPVWSPSGRFLYFSSSRGGGLNIWRVAVSSRGAPRSPPQQLTTGAGDDLELSLSPDGKRLVFSVSGIEADIWRVPLDPATGRPTGAAQLVVATTRVESRGAWSPDGRAIALNSDRVGDMNIWLHPLDGGADRQLTKGPGGDYQPNWSPDGAVIAFFSSRAGQNDIWTVTVADGALHRLTTDRAIHTNPFFSPDGRRIAYHADRDGRFQVWVMNADGSDPRQLSTAGVSGHFLRWSADGASVVFRGEPPGGTQILSVNVATGAVTRLADVAGGSHMSFSPDHARILDVRGHKIIWITPLAGGAPYQVFEFPDPSIRIDYPVWSPDGRFVLFDRDAPRGGDIWLLEGIE
jgi:serine/threonine-protein kinase